MVRRHGASGAEIKDGKSKQKHYSLNSNIGVSPNFGVEGNADVSLNGGSGTGGIGLSFSVGMTKTHTSGLQSFSTSWSVTEQYYGARSSVMVKPNPQANQTTFQAQTNTFIKNIQVYGHNYTVRVWLDTK